MERGGDTWKELWEGEEEEAWSPQKTVTLYKGSTPKNSHICSRKRRIGCLLCRKHWQSRWARKAETVR